MKKSITFLVAAAVALQLGATDYSHPNKDGLSGTVTVDSEGVTYYDYGGAAGDAKSACTGYVLFKSDDGESPVTITFEELDLDTSNANIYIYDGDCGYSGWKGAIPEGYAAQLFGTEGGYTFTSESASLSVLYYCPVFQSPGAGWKASVKAGAPTDMVFESATLSSPEAPLWRGAADAVLATLSVKNSGSLNPLNLDALTFDLSSVMEAGIVTNVRLYAKSVSEENLLATLSEGAVSLGISDRQLKGNNTFVVVADVRPDAVGTIPPVSVSAFRIGGEDREIDAALLAPVTVENNILMPVGNLHAVYTIGETADFYDAGGKDGVVPPESKGTVTFVPATDGNIIRLDPKFWELFNTSTIGKNDQFKVYAGREVNDENLIAQLLDNPRVINSTAADGSLTICFESLNGNASGAKKGWEIEVSELLPSDMVCTGITDAGFTAPTVAAGDSHVRMMVFNVHAENTLSPLEVTELEFALGQGFIPGMVTGLEVTWLGSDASNSGASVFGEAVPGADGVIKIAGNQTLVEGDNLFAVAISVAENAADASPLEIVLKNAIVGGQKVEASDAGFATSVSNVCYSTEGTHSHSIFGDWQFTHTPSSVSTGKYEAGTADQIVTFTPSDAAAKAQLTFADFDLYYTSSSYGSRATFEVYDGAGISGDLLWKLDNTEDASTGPGRRLRSTAADGSITVRFNPNASSSYYCSGGWHATVSPFIDHAAEITAVDAAQSSTAILGPGAVDGDLIFFDVQTEGTISPLSLESVKLLLRGASQIETVKIYRTVDGVVANSLLWGSAGVSASGDDAIELTITPAEGADCLLAEESNLFMVAVDLRQTVASDVEIDAALVSLGLEGGKTHAVADGDPEGSRLTKNIYIMTEEPVQTVTVGSPILVYDQGGPDGKLTAGEYTLVLVPASADDLLVLDTNSFSIGGGKLHVFSGREADEANRLGKVTGYFTVGGPENLTSKADDGSLTLKMKLIGTTLDGFELSVTPVKAVRHNVSSVTMADYSEFAATRGGSDLPVGSATLAVDGNKGVLEISSVKVDLSGSTDLADVKKLGLYFAPASDAFSPTRLVGEKVVPSADGSVEFVLAEPLKIDVSGDYNLWFAADISATATPGNTINVALTGITADGESVAIPQDSSVSRGIKAGLSGNFRVGSSATADYPTIADAVDALQGGMEGTVMFLLEDGTYNEDILVSGIQGTSADNLLIFTSASGDREKVTIAGALNYASENDAVVTVLNTPYVVFRSLTFKPVASGYGKIINYRYSSRYGTVDNCVIEAPVVAEGSYTGTVPVKVENASTSADVADNADTECDYFTIRNSRLLNGYIGLSLNSRGNVGDALATGIRVIGNTIEGYASKGIYANTLRDFEISGNTVTRSGINKSSIYAMDVYNAQGAFVIDSNRMIHEMVNGVGASISTAALYMRGAWDGLGGSSAALPARVTNNVIAVINSHNYTSYGMSMVKKYENVLIAHNTINVFTEGSDRGGYPLGLLSPGLKKNTGLQVRNNILQANSGSETASSSPLNVWDDADYSFIDFSGNAYYSNSGYVDNQSAKHDMEAYRELSGDQTSVWKKADFFGAADLHLLDAEGLTAARLDAVTVDAEGTSRPDPATVGAYEYKAVSTEAPVLAEGYPRVTRVTDTSATVLSSWSVGGSLYAMIQGADAEAPDAETLRQQRPVVIEADTEASYTFNFLDQLTSYRIWMMAESPLGNVSEIAVTEPFTTLETIEELLVDIDWDGEPLHAGETVLLQGVVSGGKAPYTYSWTDRAGNEAGNGEILSEEALCAETYRLSVTSADGQTATAKVHVDVYTNGDEVAVATFDDLGLKADSNWKYDPFNSSDTYVDSFYSGSFRFPNYPWMEYESWSGYGFANETSTEFRDWNDQFRNPVGSGAENTAGYGVAYMMGSDMTVSLMADPAGNGLAVPGMYVVNSAWALNSIRNGDGFCRKFDAEHGDYFIVSVEGLDIDGNATGKVDITMADFRPEAQVEGASSEGNIIDRWTWVDLSPLGNIFGLRLGYTSSQQQQVPAYVCIDQIGAKGANVGVAQVNASSTARLAFRDGSLILSAPESESTLAVYSPDGLERFVSRQSGDAVISLDALPAGVYIARLSGEGFLPVSLRFVKR